MKIKNYFFIILISFLLLIPLLAYAQEPCETKYPEDGICKSACDAGESPDDTSGLCSSNRTCCHVYAEPAWLNLQVPLFSYTKARDIAEYITTIYNASLYIILPIAIVAVIITGVYWILAAGNSSKIKKAKSYFIRAFIGLGLVLSSYIILSLFGLTELKGPQVEYIPAYIPTTEISTETGPSTSSYNFDNLFIPQAEAALAPDLTNEQPGEKNCAGIPITEKTFQDCINNGRVTIGIPEEWNCPKCPDVPELKQYCPRSICDYSYAGCGTIASSGCGIASLTMVVNYLVGNVTIQKVADLSKFYRNCPGQGCTVNGCPSTCTTARCVGTKYDVFVNPQQSTLDNSNKKVQYGPSTVLASFGLKGEIITGKTGDTKKEILDHLAKGEPIIISTSNQKVTAHGHFIVLIGCTDCFDDNKRIVFYRDPNMLSSTPFTKENNLFRTIKSAFWVHK